MLSKLNRFVSVIRQRTYERVRGASSSNITPSSLEISELKSRVESLENSIEMLLSTISVDDIGNVKISSSKDLIVEAVNDVNISRQGGQSILLTSDGNLSLNSHVNLVINGAMLTANVPLAKYAGMIKATTLTVDSVIAASYTPGAGNIW